MQNHQYPLVSVIIPFLNTEKFLHETIRSVMNQDYTHWEIILINDGSLDGSAQIARQYAAESGGKIIYAEHAGGCNRGAAASRNLGVSKASGEWIAFLDADDFWLPQKLKEQIVLVQKHPEATVFCEATMYWYSWCNPQSKDLYFPVGAKADTLHLPPALTLVLYPLGKGHSFCTCGLMMRTDAFRRIGGFDESFIGKDQLYEDQVLFIKICLHEKVYISSACNNLYRQRPDSLMHGLLSDGYYMKGRYYFLQWLAGYLKEKKITDKKIWSKLNNAFWPYKYPLLFRMKKMPARIARKLKSAYKKLTK